MIFFLIRLSEEYWIVVTWIGTVEVNLDVEKVKGSSGCIRSNQKGIRCHESQSKSLTLLIPLFSLIEEQSCVPQNPGDSTHQNRN
jgi:hypothetical protein